MTQAVLGGSVAYTVLGNHVGRRAILYGAVIGTLPDLDILLNFGGPVENTIYHRSFSHSIFFHLIISPLIAATFVKPKNFCDPWFVRCSLGIYSVLMTHSIVDFFTVYGTQILWPFTDYPFSYPILFIVDPAYTLPLVVACSVLLLMKKQSIARTLNLCMLFVSSCYLVWSATAKTMVDKRVAVALERKGILSTGLESTPAPLNTFLWRSILVQDDFFFEIWTSVFDEIDDIQIYRFPRNLNLIAPFIDHPNVRRLQWFTKGQFKAWQLDDQILLSDLRMGFEGAYVFNFEIGQKTAGRTAIGSFEKVEQAPSIDDLGKIWRRIHDPELAMLKKLEFEANRL